MGTGRRGGLAGAAVRQCARASRGRPLRRSRRQGGAACRRRRPPHCGRPLAGPARAPAGNLARLSLTAEFVCADVEEWAAEPFDALLLDAPCSSTGTIRRHPDVPWLKQPSDIAALAALQRRLIARAAALTKPGGVLVYCTCSLEPEEGEHAIDEFLAREAGWRRVPIPPSRAGRPAPSSRPAAAICARCPPFPIPISAFGDRRFLRGAARKAVTFRLFAGVGRRRTIPL